MTRTQRTSATVCTRRLGERSMDSGYGIANNVAQALPKKRHSERKKTRFLSATMMTSMGGIPLVQASTLPKWRAHVDPQPRLRDEQSGLNFSKLHLFRCDAPC